MSQVKASLQCWRFRVKIHLCHLGLAKYKESGGRGKQLQVGGEEEKFSPLPLLLLGLAACPPLPCIPSFAQPNSLPSFVIQGDDNRDELFSAL